MEGAIVIGKEYAYARISRKLQKIKRHIENLKKAYLDARLCQEAYIGTKTEVRKKFNKMLSLLFTHTPDSRIFDCFLSKIRV